MKLLHHRCLWQSKWIANHLFFNKGAPAGPVVRHNRTPPWLQLVAGHLIQVVFKVIFKCGSSSLFIRPRVRSLATLVTHSLPNSVLFSKLDWCDPCMWRYRLKTCWGCYCCWCWFWKTVQIWKLKFGHKAKSLSRLWAQGLVKNLKLKFSQYFAADP